MIKYTHKCEMVIKQFFCKGDTVEEMICDNMATWSISWTHHAKNNYYVLIHFTRLIQWPRQTWAFRRYPITLSQFYHTKILQTRLHTTEAKFLDFVNRGQNQAWMDPKAILSSIFETWKLTFSCFSAMSKCDRCMTITWRNLHTKEW